ncbi:MAG: XdhC family protein [Gemmatimonadaceae bacterium]|nr:XdhC family protein [Gemmatimonadaceae bacterium]
MSGLTELLRAADHAFAERPHLPLALATLYAVEGSSYRQPGARMLVDTEGRVLAGAISGGCLEGDVAAYAADVCAQSCAKQLTYDLRDDLQTIWGFDAKCDGVAHVLLEPLPDWQWMRTACDAQEQRQITALVSRIESSTAGGTRLIGACNDMVQHLVQRTLAERPSSSANVETPLLLDHDGVSLFVQPIVPPVSIVLIGAGRGAEAFARIARTLHWRVTVVDHRPAVLESLDLAPDVQRCVLRPEEGTSLLTVDERTAIALLTHQFAMDLEWLLQLLPLSLAYIGVLGSRARAAHLMHTVHERGLDVTPAMQHRFFAPIGLDLGGETPESIALASIAEIEAVVHGRPGGALRDRTSPIHSRTPTPHVGA